MEDGSTSVITKYSLIAMRTPALKNWAVILGCCSAWNVAGAAEIARGQTPVNLARPSVGAQLVVAGGKSDAAALLRDDDPLGYPLAAGDTSMTLSLPQIEVLKRFNFLNLTAAGQVTVSVSTTKGSEAGWREVQTRSFSGTDVVTCDFGSVEARQVKIDFHLDTAGRVDTFGLYGLRTLATSGNGRYAAHGEDKKALMYNYAASSPDAGVVMVSPGEDIKAAQALADGDVGTSFTFQPTDPQPMAVVDLGTTRALNRVSVAFKAGAGHLDVYLLADPKEKSALVKGTAPRTIEDVIKTDFPAGHEPILTAETGKQAGLNRLSGNVNAQSGRYLVLDFHPATGGVAEAGVATDFKDVDFKDGDFKDGGRGQQPASALPLEVSELTAYGNTPPGTLTKTPPNIPPVPPNIPPGNPFPPAPGGETAVSP